jgi:predicted kinase
MIHPRYRRRYGAHIAPLRAYVLQASYMRKWMSERLKRRKKPGDGSSKETKEATKAPEPLQPRFYDDEPAAAAAVAKPATAPKEIPVEVPVVESQRPSRPEPEPAPAAAVEPRVRTSRRRRGRGGRGGTRSRPAAAAPAVAAEASATEASAAEPVVAATSQKLEPQGVQRLAEETAASLPAQAVPARAAAAPARASKGTVVLAIGLPGSGKSSWFKRHNIHPLSSDLLRELLFDDAQEQRFQDLVFSNLRSMLKARLIARRPMNYVDATNLTPHDRQSWIKLAKDYGYDVQGVFFDVPLEVCLERHQRRGRAVPEDIMRKMAGKLRPPTFEEGFSKITVVRVKQKESAT